VSDVDVTLKDIRTVQAFLAGVIKARDMSYEDVAQELGITRSRVSQLLDPDHPSRPKPQSLHEVAKLLGLEVRVLLLPDAEKERGEKTNAPRG
jgi:transcriptional regulator with XRE-family HTH domain